MTMSSQRLFSCIILLILSSCLAAAGAGDTHHGVRVVGCYFTAVSPGCVSKLTAKTTNGEALNRAAVHTGAEQNGTGQGGPVGDAYKAGGRVARPGRSNKIKRDVPAAESTPPPYGGHAILPAARFGTRRYSAAAGLNGKVAMRQDTSSLMEEESAGRGAMLPRRRGGDGDDHTFNTIGGSCWRAHPPTGHGVVPVGAPRLNLPTNESFNLPRKCLSASGMFAAAAAGKPRHIAAAAVSKLNSTLHIDPMVNIRKIPSMFKSLVVILLTVQAGRRLHKKRGKGAAAALLVILAVAALPNGAVTARPLHGGGGGGGGHVQAAWDPVAAAPPAAAMMPESSASSGRSSCTNDPNTMEFGRPCLHN